ncbi:MAG: tetratricopeptide repeat protein [Spirochaetales bacterium]|nr:tetratricopeptide repeat protein [Spirochaetales bacterium]
MGKYVLNKFLIITLFLTILCSGCGFKEPLIEVLDGNYRYMSGDYTGATISYIKALEKKSYTEWIYYNLGNVYNALGETDAAVEELLRASKTEYQEVLFRTHFNLGNIYFGLGKYEKAIEHYKQSLKANQKEIDAKINLELAVERMEKEKSIEQNQSLIKKQAETFENKEIDTILDYIKEREALVWKLLNQAEPGTSNTDDW